MFNIVNQFVSCENICNTIYSRLESVLAHGIEKIGIAILGDHIGIPLMKKINLLSGNGVVT